MAERRKRKIEFIPDEKSRQACFENRSKTLMKKVSELSILCDVDVAAIIISKHPPRPPLVFTPDLIENQRIIRRFEQSRRRGPNHENQRSNDKKWDFILSLSLAELKSFGRSIDANLSLSLADLESLGRFLDAKLVEIDKRINALTQRDDHHSVSVIRPPIQTQWERRGFSFAALLDNLMKNAQSELYNWRSSGISVMEMCHRVKAFLSVLQNAESDLRLSLGISNEYAILFLKGGATTQFSAIPNLRKPEGLVHYLVTGSWGDKASKEALNQSPTVNYFHLCANDTTPGVELPGVVIGDMSSVDVSELGVIYEGARKNFGTSGVTLAIIKQSRR